MSSTCNHSYRGCVAGVPIFNHLEAEDLDEIMKTVHSSTYQKGEHLYHAGDTLGALYIVHKGKVRIYRMNEEGKEQLVRLLSAGDFTGELALFTNKKEEAYAEVVEDAQVCRITQDDLHSFLMQYPTIALKIMQEFATRLDTAETQTALFAQERVETRIAKYLLTCTENNTARLTMTKRDLASYLGTTPETISRRFSDMERSGIIQKQDSRTFLILDQVQLEEL
ncbi:Crp/Fnr family transcriptional regulator [Saliterribacillus persicus]|uniref:CRP/FNR family transcriptional regulator n=1 Tax=Saliterribacillus persicus TaxID=930114 RepID=A0A368YD85_9BACI|nr:Crp/Fnr family transcriptional regulator [Saliterribacillus persicus]RCW77296.1 CRP/FNR family transcriptional regulator [Saliterribacillus persicus]